MKIQPLALLAIAAWPLGAQSTEAGRYIGAEACQRCHAAQFTAQSATEHAHALSLTSAHALAKSFAPEGKNGGPILRRGNYRLQFLWDGKQLRETAADSGDGLVDIPVDWAFGAGAQAVTFVTRLDRDWYLEHSLSYFTGVRAMGLTPGQDKVKVDSLKLAVGLPYKTADPQVGAIGCFECHSTGGVSNLPTVGLQPSELGVRCEACHGPGSLHRDAIVAGNVEAARRSIQNPRRLSASELNVFCGGCHRPPVADSKSINWNEPWNVRHQPLYLDQSACFRNSKGALSCLTCHQPHEPLEREAASYNRKCASCHSAQERPPKPVCVETAPADCISCHMPRVSPSANLRFTNHWIGIYDQGAKLRPKR